jgi:hypothetical protein
VPALLNERGEKGWVEVENVVSFGEQPLKRITLSSSRLFLEISEDAIIPAYSNSLFIGTEESIHLNFKHVNEIKVTENPWYNDWYNDSILLTTKILLNISEGDQKEWEYGFALGFFISEGNLESRKRKNTNNSLAVLKGFAKKKGLSLEEYLEYMTEARRVKIAVGKNDFERGYVGILQELFKMSKPSKKKNENSYYLYFPDLNFIRLIKFYSDGFDSHTKHLKNEVYNRSLKFLEGILDGYLSGDGYCKHGKGCNSFFVNMTTNYQLYNDLIFLSKALGYDAHIIKGRFSKSPSGKLFYQLRLSIFKNWHLGIAFGLVKEIIKSVEDVGKKEAFNLVVKPLYPENDKRSVFNHLFFTAYGFLVSDAVKVFDRGALSSSLPVLVSSNGLNKEVV